MQVIRYVIDSFQRCKVTLTSVTNDHCDSQSNCLTFQFHLINKITLFNYSLMELTQHITNEFVIEMNFPFNLLDIDRLQEIPTFTVHFIPLLQVFKYFSFSRHIYILKALILLSISTSIKKEIFFLLLLLLQ